MTRTTLTAVRSGTVLVDGRPEAIIAGQTVWSRSCPELRDPKVAMLFGLHADSFGRSDALERELEMRRRIVEGAGPRPGLSRWLPDEKPAKSRSTKSRGTPSLRKGTARFTVALSESARRAILEEFSIVTRSRGVESGGWLYGSVTRSWEKTIDVRIASGPGKGAKHGPSSYGPTADYLQVEEEFARYDSDVVRIGDWHAHTGYSGEPSTADLDAWQACFVRANERHNVSRYVGLIAAEDKHSSRMQLHPFVLSYDQFGRVVCEPATVKEN
jgi:hypothetical protein